MNDILIPLNESILVCIDPKSYHIRDEDKQSNNISNYNEE